MDSRSTSGPGATRYGGSRHALRDDLWARLDRLTRAQRAVLVLVLRLVYEHGSKEFVEVEVGAKAGDWWVEDDGKLGSSGRIGESDVLRFARGLRLRTVPASPVPFSVATAPAGLVLQAMTENYLCLAPAALLADRDGGRGVCIVVEPPAEHNKPAPEDERLTVGGRRATLSDNPEGPDTLTVALDSRRVLTVYLKQKDIPVTREQLIRFTEGITVNG